MPQVLGRTPFAVAPAQVGAKGRLARAPVLAGGSACDGRMQRHFDFHRTGM